MYTPPQGAAVNVIKATTKKAQATTADRTGITPPQQYQWNTLVDYLIAQLRQKKTEISLNMENKFRELIAHFIVGIDKMCLISDAFGNFHVIGAAIKKK